MIKKLVILTLCITSMVQLIGQQTYKESKVFSKDYAYEQGEKIKITGERTFITIVTWDQNKVKAEVEVISRYSNQSQAKTDLEKIQVSFKKKGKTIYYSNALAIKSANDKPKANLKTILKLYVPETATIDINSSFGEILLDGTTEKLNIISQFSATHIQNHTG